MQEIAIYHLKSRDLIKLERQLPSIKHETPDLYEHACHVVGAYLMYASMAALRIENANKQIIWKKKIKAAFLLHQWGWLNKVATVQAKDVLEAMKMTTNTHTYWYLDKRKQSKITLHEFPERETASLDMVSIGEQYFINITGGFIDTSNGLVVSNDG